MDGPADVVFVRWPEGPGFPEPFFGNRLPHGHRELAVGHRVGTQEQGQEQLPGVYEEAVVAQQADGDGTPQAAGVGEEAAALGGQRELAARPAGQAQVLGEVAQLVQVVQVVLGPRRAGEVPPEPVRAVLDELPVEVAGLGEGVTAVQLVQQPAQRGKGVGSCGGGEFGGAEQPVGDTNSLIPISCSASRSYGDTPARPWRDPPPLAWPRYGPPRGR